MVVIGRSFGAGGRSVGRAVAEALGVPYYDKEILSEAAQQSGMSRRYLESVDEAPARQGARGGLMASDEPFASPESLALRLQRETVEAIASRGPCVIVGRRADQIVRAMGLPALSVFVTAPLDVRARHVAARDGVSIEEAERRVRRADRERAEYYNALSDARWGAVETYDLCLDAGSLGVQGAARVIAAAARN